MKSPGFCLFFIILAQFGWCDEISDGCGEISVKAENGDAEAQFKLAFAYIFAHGLAKSNLFSNLSFSREAMCSNERSANITSETNSWNESSANITKEANKGDGTSTEWLTKAFEWLTKAAEQGHAVAQHNLGQMYCNGDCCPVSYVKAYAWTSNACTNGDEKANDTLSAIKQKMTPEDISKAQALAAEISERIKSNKKK